MAREILFNEVNCNSCSDSDDVFCCEECLRDIGSSYYESFRRLAPQADKVVIIAHNSNWQGKTGYLVVDFNTRLLANIRCKTARYVKTFYREGRKMYILGSNHDVPQGGVWELVPIVSRGRSNDKLIASAINSRNKK